MSYESIQRLVIGGGVVAMVVFILKQIFGPLISDRLAKHREEWNRTREEIVEEMLDEVSAAKDGDLPGKYGNYHSTWEEIPEGQRDRIDSNLRSDFERYVDNIHSLNGKIEHEEELARHFISDLPGGEFDEKPRLTVDILTDGHGHIEPQPVKDDLDHWLATVWPAFEDSDSAEEVKTKIREIYRQSQYSVETLGFWETHHQQPHWHNDFWEIYDEKELLEPYYSATQEKHEYESKVKSVARDLDEVLRNINNNQFLN